MSSNTEGCNSFFHLLQRHLEYGHAVEVSIFDVESVDSAAILILLAVMIRFKAAGIRFGGDYPRRKDVKRYFTRSGFFTALYNTYEERESYSLDPKRGLHSHADKHVNAELTARVISNAAVTVWGEPRRCQGVQRILLELMQNTNNHASPTAQGEKHWWFSVEHDKARQRVTFTFVDLGVGVFESLDSKGRTSKWYGWRAQFFAFFRQMDNAEIMREILVGSLHQTVTKQSFRGKGLPGIREVLERGGVSNLRVITNDVDADVSAEAYRQLKVPFGGTLVIWQLDPSNHSAPAYD